MYQLEMKRGKRLVLIGLFPNKYRVQWAVCHLEWDGSWKPVIRKI